MIVSLNVPSSSSTSSSSISSCAVHVSPSVLASILDQHLRRPPPNDRVFGSLLGFRSSNNVLTLVASVGAKHHFVQQESSSSQPLLYLSDDAEGDRVLSHLSKAYGNADILGWYTTSPDLHAYTPVIHAQYAAKTDPSPPMLLTVCPQTLSIRAYTAHFVAQDDSSVTTFVPLQTSLKADDAERPALNIITNASSPQTPTPQTNPLLHFSHLLNTLSQNLDSVIAHIKDNRNDRGSPANERVARFLLENVSKAPTSSKEAIADDFNSQLGVCKTSNNIFIV